MFARQVSLRHVTTDVYAYKSVMSPGGVFLHSCHNMTDGACLAAIKQYLLTNTFQVCKEMVQLLQHFIYAYTMFVNKDIV